MSVNGAALKGQNLDVTGHTYVVSLLKKPLQWAVFCHTVVCVNVVVRHNAVMR